MPPVRAARRAPCAQLGGPGPKMLASDSSARHVWIGKPRWPGLLATAASALRQAGGAPKKSRRGEYQHWQRRRRMGQSGQRKER
eukprot:scaffold267413_cov31-Tisochrysis_lutea.AAC.4